MLDCYRDPVQFCLRFFPHAFPSQIPWFHRGILAVALGRTEFLTQYGDLEKIKAFFKWEEGSPAFEWAGEHLALRPLPSGSNRILFIMPPGFGKSTILRIVAIFNLVYRDSPFSMFVGDTPTAARSNVKWCQNELKGNVALQAVFGKLNPDNKSSRTWSSLFAECNNDCAVAGAGYSPADDSKVRGVTYHSRRPKLILIDDCENTDSISQTEKRRRLREWFWAEPMEAVDTFDPEAKVLIFGTLHGTESIYAHVSSEASFNTMKFPALLGEETPLWPDMLPKRLYEQKMANAMAIGQLVLFQCEYQCDPSPVDLVRIAKFENDRREVIIDQIIDVAPEELLTVGLDYLTRIGRDREGHTLDVTTPT